MTRDEVEELIEILRSGEHLVLLLDVTAEEMLKCQSDKDFARVFIRQKFEELLEEMLDELPNMDFDTSEAPPDGNLN